jgi:hypothetical protein
MEHLAPHWQGALPSMRAPRSHGAAPEEDRRGRAAGHAPRRDARVLGPDRARPCTGSEAEAAPLPGGPPRSQPWSRARGGPPRPGGRARAAPGCMGAGARPRPPLRRIRGRGHALAWRTAEEPAVEPRPRRTAEAGRPGTRRAIPTHLVGGAGPLLRGVEARGAGARPPPAPLQALQLLLCPPAQHLREYIKNTLVHLYIICSVGD